MAQQDPLIQVLKKMRRKLWLQNILHWLVNGLLTAAGLVFLLMVAVHWYPVIYVQAKMLYAVTVIITASLFIGLLLRPSLKEAAVVGDSTGLEERLITFWEYRGADSPLIKMLEEEVEDTILRVDPVSRYRLKIKGKKLLISAIVFVLAMGIYFLPSETRQVAEKREEVNRQIEKEADKLNKLQQELASQMPGGEDKKELLTTLAELERRLNRSQDYERAAAEVAAAQKDLVQPVGKPTAQDMRTLSGIFAGIGAGHRDLQKALESGNMNRAAELGGEEQFTDLEQEELLRNLKAQRTSIQKSGIKDELTSLQTALEKKALTGEKLKDVLQSMEEKELQQVEEDTLAKLQQSKERLLARSDSGMKNSGGEDPLAAFARGEISDYSHGEVSPGLGGDLAAGGTGDSAVNSSQGVGGGGRTASGEGTGESFLGEVRKQEQATRLREADGQSSQVQGQWDEKGSVIDKTADQVPTVTGEFQSLEKAWVQFREQGLEYVLKQDIPLQRQELVMQYFNQLNGGSSNGAKSD